MSRSVKDSQGNWHIVAGAGGGGGGNDNCFIGTIAEWNALTPTEKDVFTSRDIVDDFNGFPIDNAPTENSNSLVRSGGVYSAISNVNTYISGVEDSDTASQAYTEGSYLIYNKILYKVISAIALGDALTSGTNISSTKVTDELVDIKGAVNNLIITGSTTVLASITSASDSSEHFFPTNVTTDNFKYIAVVTIHGYPSTDLLIPSGFFNCSTSDSSTSRFTVTHGRPVGGYGSEYILMFSKNSVKVIDGIYRVGSWTFSGITIYGIN